MIRMAHRGAVAVGAALLLVTGAPVAYATPATASASQGTLAAAHGVTKARVKATIAGTYSVLGSGQVVVNLQGTAKKAKVTYRKANSRKKASKTVKLRSGTASLTLPAGSLPLFVKGLAGGGLAASPRVNLTAETGAAPVQQPANPAPVPAPSTNNAGGGNAADYAYLGLQEDGSGPVAWSPCAQIRVAVDLGEGGTPSGELDLVTQAVNGLAGASGLPMVLAGTTEQRSGLPAGTDIIFRFTGAPVDGDGNSGEGGFSGVRATRADTGQPWSFISSGFVTITTAGLAQFPANQRLELYMHELGHAVGLDHAQETSQIMYPIDDNAGETPVWGAGDLTGLQALGHGPCRA